jgi:hypothetical protein
MAVWHERDDFWEAAPLFDPQLLELGPQEAVAQESPS